MKKVLIFVLSLPLLIIALLWVIVTIPPLVFVLPIIGLLNILYALQGRQFDWSFLLAIPTMGIVVYLDVTGFFPFFCKKLADL